MNVERILGCAIRCVLVVSLMSMMAGCASWRGGDGGATAGRAPAAGESEPMTQPRLEQIFAKEVDAITGPPGAIQTQVEGINLYCISDPANDRMRLLAPIARVDSLDPRVLGIMMQANFHTTLDARYAISEGVVFAAYIHALSSLAPSAIPSAMEQTLNLVRNFGTTYSSGAIGFGVPSGAAEPDANP